MRIFPVSKNARFTHVMANFGLVVRGKRFSAHEAADPALAHEQGCHTKNAPHKCERHFCGADGARTHDPGRDRPVF